MLRQPKQRSTTPAVDEFFVQNRDGTWPSDDGLPPEEIAVEGVPTRARSSAALVRELQRDAERLSPAERKRRAAARRLAKRDPALDHFHCSACGAEVVRPPEMSPAEWEQKRRCDACIAFGKTEPSPGQWHCRRCRKAFARDGGFVRFCPDCRHR